MSIIETITDSSHFYHWLQQSGSYKDNFSYDGANAVQEYFDNLSDDMSEPVEFDPIAWCVEFTEYDSVGEAYLEHFGNYDDVADQEQRNRTPENCPHNVTDIEDGEEYCIECGTVIGEEDEL